MLFDRLRTQTHGGPRNFAMIALLKVLLLPCYLLLSGFPPGIQEIGSSAFRKPRSIYASLPNCPDIAGRYRYCYLDDAVDSVARPTLRILSILMENSSMSQQTGTGTREARGEWLTALSLVIFVISTTVFDTRIMAANVLLLNAIFLPVLMFVQGYIIWYYFNRFRPSKKGFSACEPEIVGSYLWLFVLAMVGTSLMAIIGFYLLRSWVNR